MTTKKETSLAKKSAKSCAPSASVAKAVKRIPKASASATDRIVKASGPSRKKGPASEANAYMLEAMRIGYWDKK